MQEETKAGLDPRVTAAARGDRQAAHALLRELLPRVRNLIRYVAQRDSDVDDIAQQVLIEMLHSFATFRGEGSLTAWTDRITVRVAMRQLKRRRFEQQRLNDVGPTLALLRQPSDPEYAARRDMVRSLDTLPVEQREAVVLHHVVGMSVPELAATLDIPFETARSRLRLGVGKLRAALQGEAASSTPAVGTPAHDAHAQDSVDPPCTDGEVDRATKLSHAGTPR